MCHQLQVLGVKEVGTDPRLHKVPSKVTRAALEQKVLEPAISHISIGVTDLARPAEPRKLLVQSSDPVMPIVGWSLPTEHVVVQGRHGEARVIADELLVRLTADLHHELPEAVGGIDATKGHARAADNVALRPFQSLLLLPVPSAQNMVFMFSMTVSCVWKILPSSRSMI
jgi:hypothetical protein